MNPENAQLGPVIPQGKGPIQFFGMGRLHGPEALNDFLETKHIYLEAGKN